MLENAYKLGYCTDFLLRIYFVSDIVDILSVVSFNPHNNPLRCRFNVGK